MSNFICECGYRSGIVNIDLKYLRCPGCGNNLVNTSTPSKIEEKIKKINELYDKKVLLNKDCNYIRFHSISINYFIEVVMRKKEFVVLIEGNVEISSNKLNDFIRDLKKADKLTKDLNSIMDEAEKAGLNIQY